MTEIDLVDTLLKERYANYDKLSLEERIDLFKLEFDLDITSDQLETYYRDKRYSEDYELENRKHFNVLSE